MGVPVTVLIQETTHSWPLVFGVTAAHYVLGTILWIMWATVKPPQPDAIDQCASVSDIVVVWNKGVPPNPATDYNSPIPVRIRVEAKNSMNNRFRPDPEIINRAVFMLDDDILMPCSKIENSINNRFQPEPEIRNRAVLMLVALIRRGSQGGVQRSPPKSPPKSKGCGAFEPDPAPKEPAPHGPAPQDQASKDPASKDPASC
eukprot:gene9628-7542_t